MNRDRIRTALGRLLTIGSVALWIIVIYYAATQLMPRAQYGVLFLGGVLAVYIVSEVSDLLEDPLDSNDWLHLGALLVSAVIVLITSIYLFVEFDALYMHRVGYAYGYEYVIAAAFSLAMIYLTWRSFGMTFLAVVVGGILYGHFGYLIPGILGHGGLSVNRLLLILVLEIEGFFGFLNRLMAAWIALFLLYAGLLQAYGAFDLVFRIAATAGKYIESGVAQTAVIASAVIGSINGSQTANAGMTGSITIPLMKKNGIKGSTAGGIEAVASTSGQVLPPVMGAGAFVMANLLGISYVNVLIAGLLPATILLISIFVAVHYTSVNQLDSAVMDDAVEGTLSTSEKVTEGLRFGIPFAILVWVLGIAQYTVMTAALYTAIAMIITGISFPVIESTYAMLVGKRSVFIDDDTKDIADLKGDEIGEMESTVVSRTGGMFATYLGGAYAVVKPVLGPVVEPIRGILSPVGRGVQRTRRFRPFAQFGRQFDRTIWGFKRGAMVMAPVAIILAAINGVVDILITTGVPSIVTLALMDLSGGILLVAAILAMIICILLGLGMPTTAAYTIVALLVAPTLENAFLLPDLAAHYFVFYGAILAGLTPPIATCAAVASGIAEADFWETCFEGIKISAPLWILPFAFVYHPYMVDGTFDSATLILGGIVLLGSVSMIYGINYPFRYRRSVSVSFRSLFIGVGMVTMVHPSRTIQFAGVAAIALLVFITKSARFADIGILEQAGETVPDRTRGED